MDNARGTLFAVGFTVAFLLFTVLVFLMAWIVGNGGLPMMETIHAGSLPLFASLPWTEGGSEYLETEADSRRGLPQFRRANLTLDTIRAALDDGRIRKVKLDGPKGLDVSLSSEKAFRLSGSDSEVVSVTVWRYSDGPTRITIDGQPLERS